jgi:hypothetical protein
MHPGCSRVDLENRSDSASVNELRHRALWISDFDVSSFLHTCRNLWKLADADAGPSLATIRRERLSGQEEMKRCGWSTESCSEHDSGDAEIPVPEGGSG